MQLSVSTSSSTIGRSFELTAPGSSHQLPPLPSLCDFAGDERRLYGIRIDRYSERSSRYCLHSLQSESHRLLRGRRNAGLVKRYYSKIGQFHLKVVCNGRVQEAYSAHGGIHEVLKGCRRTEGAVLSYHVLGRDTGDDSNSVIH